jgi:hypothetical protein
MEDAAELLEASFAHHEWLASMEGDFDCRNAQLGDTGGQKTPRLFDDVAAEESRVTGVAVISVFEEVTVSASQIAHFRDFQNDVSDVDCAHG